MNSNLWSDCQPVPPFTPTPTPSITASPTNTPSHTPTLTASPTNTQTPTQTQTPTPSITPSITPSPSPVPVVSFYVSSGSTALQACQTGPSFYVYAQDLGNCAGCLPFNCWACLTTSQQVYLDPLLTIPVGNGYYNTNMDTSGGNNYATWYIVGGFPQPAGFGGCGIVPTPTMTSTPTQTPTPTLTPTQTNTFCSTKEMNPAGNATYSYYLCDGTLIQRVSDPTTYTACIRNNPGVIVFTGVVVITDLGMCS